MRLRCQHRDHLDRQGLDGLERQRLEHQNLERLLGVGHRNQHRLDEERHLDVGHRLDVGHLDLGDPRHQGEERRLGVGRGPCPGSS